MPPGSTVRSLLVGLLVAVCGGRTSAGEPAALDESDRRAFAWFDDIGLPSTAGRPYVRITLRPEGAKSEPWCVEGFLLAETDAAWTVLRSDLWTQTVERAAATIPATLERVDLAEVAEAHRRRLHAAAAGEAAEKEAEDLPERLLRSMEVRLGEHAEALAFARHLAEHGLEGSAKGLLEEARRLPRLRDGSPVEVPLEEIAADQLAESVLWRITLDFGEAAVPRAALLGRLRGWRRSFPRSEHLPKADEAIRLLGRMVEEDAAHPLRSVEEVERLPPEDRIAEWIWRLRDQNGEQIMQPGSPSIFFRWGSAEEGKTPADRLVALGEAAVPALIEALTDDRFTRTVGYWRNFVFSHYVVRIGDAALEILERTTRQRFWTLTYTAASMTKDGEAAEVQARYRAWWAEVAGFLAPLEALVAERDGERRRALAAAIPDRGPGRIAGAPEGADWGTGRVLEALPGLTLRDAKGTLRLLLDASPHPRTKALAAWMLWDLGERDVLRDVVAAWEGLDERARADRAVGGPLAAFLASCGDAEGIRALGKDLERQPPAVRALVLLAFHNEGLGAVRGLSADGGGGITEPWRLTGAAAEAAEDLIARLLTDRTEDPLGVIPRQDPIASMDPRYDAGRRTADLASRVLALRWPADYQVESRPVRSADEWEEIRRRFADVAKARRAERSPPR